MNAERVGRSTWWGSCRAEWGKAWSVRPPALWLLTAVFIALITGTSLANDFVHALGQGEVPRGSTMPVLDAVGPSISFAQIAVAAFAIALVTPEYAHGVVAVTFWAQPRRWPAVLGKATVAVVVAVCLGAAVGVLTGLSAHAVLGDLAADHVAVGALALGSAGVFAMAAALGVAVSFATRSAVGALSVSFVLLVVTLAAPGSLGRWLPGQAGGAWLEDLAHGTSTLQPASVLVGWSVVPIVLAIAIVVRRDA